MNDFIRLNIAIKPPENIIEEAVKSQEINELSEAYFVLDNENFLPHITLYSPEYPTENKRDVLTETERLLMEIKPFSLQATKRRAHLGYIDIAFEKNDFLINLHETIVRTLNPLRNNHLREKYTKEEVLSKYRVEQQSYIKDFGYSEVFNSWVPHLTLSRIKQEDKSDEIIKSPNSPFQELQVTTIAAYTMGEHGTCTGIIKEFPLI